MIKKYLQSLASFLFWVFPILIWLFWQLIVLNPQNFFRLLIIAIIFLPFVTYEAVNRKFKQSYFLVIVELIIFITTIYFFSSLIKVGWGLQLIWIYFIWHLYRYLIFVRKYYTEKKLDFIDFSFYHSLVNIFLLSSLIFGLQVTLSLSFWPLLAASAPLVLISIISLAIRQNWFRSASWRFWLFLAILELETLLVLSFLPLNYLVSGVLAALFYYSALNFSRLYFENRLTRKKIKNYALFTIVSLIIIFLTARWL